MPPVTATQQVQVRIIAKKTVINVINIITSSVGRNLEAYDNPHPNLLSARCNRMDLITVGFAPLARIINGEIVQKVFIFGAVSFFWVCGVCEACKS